MAGYIGNKSQTLVDGYTTTEADAKFVNDPNDVITVDGSNVGIGISPSSWASGFTTVQVEGASIWSTGGDAALTSNAYYDGSNYRYVNNGAASKQYHNTDGSIIWEQASSGTAGNITTFSEAMRIDSSGNVGIGTSSPSEKLEVNGVLQIKTASSVHPAMRFVEGTTTRGYIGSGDWAINGLNDDDLGVSAAGTGDLVLGTSSGSERMRIDSAGRVTMPYQPNFKAYSQGFSVAAGWKEIGQNCTSVTHNTGNAYNTTTGRFTAPVAGSYLFNVGGWANPNSNGSRYAFCFRVNSGAHTFISGSNYCLVDSPITGSSEVIFLNAGDFVQLDNYSSLACTYGGGHVFFWSGHLIG